MECTSEQSLVETGGADAQSPALRRLGIRGDELQTLRRQGYLTCDRRLAEGVGYWRLRFRSKQRMRTVYLGTDAARVEQVRQELAALRSARLSRRRLIDAVKRCRRAVRGAKKRSAPVVASLGYHFHGDALRKSRRPAGCSRETQTQIQPRTDSQSPVQATAQPEMQAPSEPQMQTQGEPQAQTEMQPQTQLESDMATETDIETHEQPMRDLQDHERIEITNPPPTEPQVPLGPPSGPAPAFCQRLQAIREYGLAEGQRLDPQAAVLRGVNSDLLEAELYVGDALLKNLRSGSNSAEDLEACRLPFDTVLRLTKQIGQFMRLEQQIAKTEPRDASQERP